MSGWHYQARKIIYRHPEYDEVSFELVEVYPDIEPEEDGTPAHTADAVTVQSDSQEGLAKWLRMAADDVEKYPVIDDGVLGVKGLGVV